MKKNCITLFCSLVCTIGVAWAQDSLQVQPSPALPQGQYDSVGQELQKEERVEVQQADIPSIMKDELQRNEKYKGWENGAIYFEKNSNQYLVHVVRENTTQTFRFDKSGKPVMTDSGPQGEESKQ
jgi:hypothetical protein